MTTEERWYQLASFTAGTRTIPEPVATYRDRGGAEHDVRGRALRVTVRSGLPADWQRQDIRDVKPLMATPLPWWAWGLLLAVLVGAIAGCWWWRRRQPARPGPPPPPPHQIALTALARLRQEALPSQGRYEEFYVRLSGIIRTYIEGRFGVRAPEMTTEEFLQAAARAQALSPEQRQLLGEFLVRSDLVKFARYQPVSPEAEEASSVAERFVHETKSASQHLPRHALGRAASHAARRRGSAQPDGLRRQPALGGVAPLRRTGGPCTPSSSLLAIWPADARNAARARCWDAL